MKNEPVALFDLDGTLADYDKALKRDMIAQQSPTEPSYAGVPDDKAPGYLRNRAKLIHMKIGGLTWSL